MTSNVKIYSTSKNKQENKAAVPMYTRAGLKSPSIHGLEE